MTESPQRPPKRKKQKIAIDLDADEQNANWLRIIEQRRQQQEESDRKQQPHDDATRD